MIPKATLKLRTDAKNKKNTFPLVIQMIYERKVYRMGTGISLSPDEFLNDSIIGKSKDAHLAKIKTRDILSDIDKKLLGLYVAGQLTHQSIKAIFTGKETTSSLTMMGVYDAVSTIYKNTISEGRMIGIRSSVRKFEKWSKSMLISDANHTTMKQYQGHLMSTNKLSSVIADMKDMKSIINKAIENNIITNDPFKGYKLPPLPKTKRDYLLPDEVSKIEQLADDKDKNIMLRTVAAWFVLGCYSGMRYGDIVKWNENDMVRGELLYFSDEKTNTPQFVPIYDRLRTAIVRVREFRRIYENQVCNRILKEIASVCEINHHITTHIARHTFATNFINNGGRMELLQRFLGHAKISTTEIYGKISNNTIINEGLSVFSKVNK